MKKLLYIILFLPLIGVSQDINVEGCTQICSSNFNPNATIDDGSCAIEGLGCGCVIVESYEIIGFCNQNPVFNCEYDEIDYICHFGGPVNYGCTHPNASNYDSTANVDDGTCISIVDQLNQSFDAWNISIDLSAGWNMFGYGCPTSINVADGLSNHTESIIITKDNSGNVYMPEFGFNGIGDFTPGFGYQIKLTEAIEGFSLCDWYVNDIPVDNIIGLSAENSLVSDSLIVLLNQNCIQEGYCGYSEDDDACYYSNQGYDCDGNFIPQIGHEVMGGILFYYDEDLNRGLVVAQEDVGNAPWGCFGFNVNGLNSSIGSGLNNSILITQQCDEIPNAAQLCLEYESNGYSDWYLPSYEELLLMWSSVGQGAQYIGNVAYFNDAGYWSSNQQNITDAKFLFFDHFAAPNYITNYSKGVTLSVRPIRSFGSWDLGCTDSNADNYDPDANADDGSCYRLGCMSDWADNYDNLATTDDGSCYRLGCISEWADNYDELATIDEGSCYRLGCMDTLACNYNTEANISDGSCTYAEQGYDCEGNVTAEIGDIIEGGYLFYFDESGKRGLVAAMDDLSSTYQWGCMSVDVPGAQEYEIGYGLQNTNYIVAECSETPIAASQALAYESAGYNDWFLPSKDELILLYQVIGENYINTWHWSSSQVVSDRAWDVSFYDGVLGNDMKSYNAYVCPIRAFGNWTIGCMDETACNYNPEANMADGSCTYPEQGYDCEGNITEYVVGMEAEGGVVFYVDETGHNGLVASLNPINLGGNLTPLGYVYHWGCYGSNVDGADEINIGSGYQNTIDIINQGCVSTDVGNLTAAAAVNSYAVEDYNDWFLPSKEELSLMMSILNEYFDGLSTYWSSSEESSSTAWTADANGNFYNSAKDNYSLVLPIRGFGNWIMGCMDEAACNYNIFANMADGSCTYTEQGYDCYGNITEYFIGMEAKGGIVFYIDDTGQHGLVAAMEDLGSYPWGCYGTNISGAEGQSIGTGYQNTLNIVYECTDTPIAASEALAYESGGYSDWYLPSEDELTLMKSTLANQGTQADENGFIDAYYWSSTERYSSEWNHAQCIGFNYWYSGGNNNYFKSNSYRVRPIRSF